MSANRDTLVDEAPGEGAKRILLISGTAPGEYGVGGVILKDLVEHVGVDAFHCFWINNARNGESVSLLGLDISCYPRRYETGWIPFAGPVGAFVGSCVSTCMRSRNINSLVRRLEEKIASYRPDLILCVLDAISVVEVAARITAQVNVPIHSIVWDDVDLFCDSVSAHRSTRSAVHRSFRTVLRASAKVAVICENMRAEYRKRYQIESVVLRHGLSDAILTSSMPPRLHDDNRLLIGFAGSITTPDCVEVLIRVLDECGWEVNGRRVCLRMLGARYLLWSKSRQWIEYLGWRSVHETRDLLNQCDFLYLPQTFNPAKRYFSEFSFPTKLSTYVAARRPILLHAPSYASLSEFWTQYELGPNVQTLTEHDLWQAISRIAAADDTQERFWQSQLSKAHRQALSEDLFFSGCRKITEINVTAG